MNVRRVVIRTATAWLALEFTTAVLAISIVVSVLPVIAVLLARPAEWLLAVVAVLAVSIPTGVLLGMAALGISRELLAEVSRP